MDNIVRGYKLSNEVLIDSVVNYNIEDIKVAEIEGLRPSVSEGVYKLLIYNIRSVIRGILQDMLYKDLYEYIERERLATRFKVNGRLLRNLQYSEADRYLVNGMVYVLSYRYQNIIVDKVIDKLKDKIVVQEEADVVVDSIIEEEVLNYISNIKLEEEIPSTGYYSELADNMLNTVLNNN